MESATEPRVTQWTALDLVQRFGPLPLRRVRFDVPPGTATERDVVRIFACEKRLCELVDGVLVEKAMGYWESVLAITLGRLLGNFVAERNLGVVAGEAGMMRLAPGLVRIPDLSFVSWARLPGGPREPLPDLVPDLAVEILSEGNTEQEMAGKRHEFFGAGCRQMWFVDVRARTVEVFFATDRSVLLREGQVLEGGDILPGFSVPLVQLFGEPTPDEPRTEKP